MVKEIFPEDFAALYKENEALNLIDVREEDEYEEMRLEKATLVPLSQLSETFLTTFDKEKPLFIICHSGSRSFYAAQILSKWGFKETVNVVSGIIGAVNQGLDVKRGK